MLSEQAEFGLNWLDNTLATRDQGGEIINIPRRCTRVAALTESVEGQRDRRRRRLEGKVGVWLCGNENELYAALTKEQHRPEERRHDRHQPSDMNLFLNAGSTLPRR